MQYLLLVRCPRRDDYNIWRLQISATAPAFVHEFTLNKQVIYALRERHEIEISSQNDMVSVMSFDKSFEKSGAS